MSDLSSLPNVGKVLEKLLVEVDISTPEQLRKIGAEETFVRIRTRDPGACLHMFYGIQGAIEGIKDKFLADSTKQKLKKFYNGL